MLIVTQRTDEHGRLVAQALMQKGVQVIRWFTQEYLLTQKSALSIQSSGNTSFKIKEERTYDFQEVAVVWFRRAEYPHIPKYAHPEDVSSITAENEIHMRALWLSLERSAVWVNPLSARLKATNKIWQLQEAASVGLSIPNTLVSNDREEIFDFIHRHQQGGAIYKTFSSPHWSEGFQVIPALTNTISIQQLPSQAVLALTPGIYQQYVPKAFEVRAHFFKDQCISIKLHNTTEVDWRPWEVLEHLKLSSYTLPDIVQQRCVQFMEALGIVFGCFDFIVTPQGEHVFLEVNEMGQFLWVEQRLPELKLLDTFCNFLITCAGKKAPVLSQAVELTMSAVLETKEHQSLLEQDKEQFLSIASQYIK